MSTSVRERYAVGTVLHGLRIAEFVAYKPTRRANGKAIGGAKAWFVEFECLDCGNRFVARLDRVVRDVTTCDCWMQGTDRKGKSQNG